MLRCPLSLSLLMALSFASPPGFAAEPAAGPVESLALAVTLYDQAMGKGDALQMAVAARIAGGIHQREARLWQEERQSAGAGGTLQAAPQLGLDILLSGAAWEGALLMAEEDALLADTLAITAAPQPQGGVSRLDRSLAPGALDLWRLPFDGQSPAEIAVFALPPQAEAGGGDRAISPAWRVETVSGDLVCPRREGPWPACRFTPEANGFYRIVIENPGDAPLSYALISN